MTQQATRIRSTVLTRPTVVVVGAIGVGTIFDVLAFARPHGPGLAIALVLTTGSIWFAMAANGQAARESGLIAVTGIGAALVPMWRSSTVLVILAVLVWLATSSIMVRRSGWMPIRQWTMGTYLRAGLEPVAALGEPFLMVSEDIAGRGRSRLAQLTRVIPLVRGLALGAVVVTFFAVLFGSADPIFAQIVSDAFDLDLSFERIVRFAFVAGGLAWWTAGMARRGARGDTEHTPVRPAGHGLVESRIVLGTVNLLFMFFLAVQFEYFFVGEVGRVDLGYAEYARRGFFELVTVAVCVAALILCVDWVVNRRDRGLDGLHALLVVQTFIVMSSAVVRMKAYTDAFGLSELRWYTSVFMAWTAIALVALTITVLRGRRDQFALAVFVSGLCVVLGLVISNPDAIIAGINLDRAVSGSDLDVDYLRGLSNDAVPAVVRRLGSLPDEIAWRVEPLLADWIERSESHAQVDGWRSWSLADHRAASALERAITAPR